MDWVVNIIDAVTRFYREAGAVGSLIVVFFGGIMTMMILVVWRHSGSIVKAIESIAQSKEEDVHARKKVADELQAHTIMLAQQNTLLSTIKDNTVQVVTATKTTADKISEWPSDPKKDLCKAEDARKQSEVNAKLLEELDRRSAERLEALQERIRDIVLANRNQILGKEGTG